MRHYWYCIRKYAVLCTVYNVHQLCSHFHLDKLKHEKLWRSDSKRAQLHVLISGRWLKAEGEPQAGPEVLGVPWLWSFDKAFPEAEMANQTDRTSHHLYAYIIIYPYLCTPHTAWICMWPRCHMLSHRVWAGFGSLQPRPVPWHSAMNSTDTTTTTTTPEPLPSLWYVGIGWSLCGCGWCGCGWCCFLSWFDLVCDPTFFFHLYSFKWPVFSEKILERSW